MLLKDKFYSITNQTDTKHEGSAHTAAFRVAILPDCNVYDGHFPGNPVCPGVCNIETIKECTMVLLDQPLRISSIKQCRLTAIATPTVCPEVTITVNASDNGSGTYTIQASIADEKQTYMLYKGEMKAE